MALQAQVLAQTGFLQASWPRGRLSFALGMPVGVGGKVEQLLKTLRSQGSTISQEQAQVLLSRASYSVSSALDAFYVL